LISTLLIDVILVVAYAKDLRDFNGITSGAIVALELLPLDFMS
jgi:hypothetical protein